MRLRISDPEGRPLQVDFVVQSAAGAELQAGRTSDAGEADLVAGAWLFVPALQRSVALAPDDGLPAVELVGVARTADADTAAALARWLPAVLGVLVTLAAAALVPDADALSMRPVVVASESTLPEPEWHVWPEDNASRMTTEGRAAVLVNPPSAGDRDVVTGCFDAGLAAWRTGKVEVRYQVTSAGKGGMARVFGRVMVPGEPPRITPLYTTHDTTPRRLAEGVVRLADNAKAVQVCGATSGPEITLELEVPDGA